MRFMRNTEHGEEGFDDDPMSSVGNLFDIVLVFIVALLWRHSAGSFLRTETRQRWILPEKLRLSPEKARK